jgi:hypothetical protein
MRLCKLIAMAVTTLAILPCVGRNNAFVEERKQKSDDDAAYAKVINDRADKIVQTLGIGGDERRRVCVI